MNFNPKDFYIGVVEFFTILLPGTILTLFIYPRISRDFLEVWKIDEVPKSGGIDLLLILLVGYILGNILFAVASYIDKSYNKILRKWFESNFDLPYLTAKKIRDSYLFTDKELDELRKNNSITACKYSTIYIECKNKGYDPEIINTYRWSQNYLKINKPELYSEVQRIEADSKFFRSLVVVFFIFGICLFWEKSFLAGSISLLIMAASYYRYAEQRFKSTERAYELVVTAENMSKNTVDENIRCLEKKDSVQENLESTSLTVKNIKINDERQQEINYLSRGFRNSVSHIEILPKSTYYADKLLIDAPTFYCSKGKGSLLYKNDQNQTIKVNLSPKACITIPKGKINQIQNESIDPMLVFICDTNY